MEKMNWLNALLLFLPIFLQLASAQIFLPFNFQANLGEILQKLQTYDRHHQANTPPPTPSHTLPPLKNKSWKKTDNKAKNYPDSYLNGVRPSPNTERRTGPSPAQWRPPPMPRSDKTSPPRLSTSTTEKFTPSTIATMMRTLPTRPSLPPATLPSLPPSTTTTTTALPPVPLGLASCEPGKRCYFRLRSFDSDVPLFQYAYSHSTPVDALIQAVFDSTKGTVLPPPLTWNVTVSPEVVQLSLNLMRFSKPNRVLVVGVFTGLSVIGAASSINERGLVVGIEDPRHSEYWQLIGNKYAQQAGLMRRIQIRSEFPIPQALDQLSRSEPGSFDFAILDDPALENYQVEYEKCLTLLRSGAMLLINDAYAFGEVLSGPGMRSSKGEIMDQLNRKAKTDPRVSSTFLPIGNGVLMVVKK